MQTEAETAPRARAHDDVTLRNLDDAEITFKLYEFDSNGEPRRGRPTKVDGREVAGKIKFDLLTLGARSNELEGGENPEQFITAGEYARLLKTPGNKEIIAGLIKARKLQIYGAASP